MQKVWKKIAVLVCVFCLTLTAAIFCACGAEKETYTVKVVLPDADETPVEGLELTFCDEADETKKQEPVLTDKDGKVEVTYKKANYRVRITGELPEGYALFNADSDAYCTKNWGSRLACVITLDKADTEYTVTVAKLSGAAVADVDVLFTPDSDTAKAITGTTNENGELKIGLPANINYLVTLDLDSLPEGFAMQPADLNGISTANGTSIGFTLSPGQNYSFEVTGPEGVNLEGIAISYAPTATGASTVWGVTDEDGKLSVVKPAASGFAFITPPNGYVYNEYYGEKDSPYILKKGTMTFKLLKMTALTPETEMSEMDQYAFAQVTANDNFTAMMAEEGRVAYSFNAEIAEGETQVFSFTTQDAGMYYTYANFTDCEIKAYDSLKFTAGVIDFALNNIPSKSMSLYLDCPADTTYYFTVTAANAQTVQLVFVTPEEKNDYTAESEGEYEITIKNNLPATVYFRPSESGAYTLTIRDGETGYLIEQISQATKEPIREAGSKTGTVEFKISYSELYDVDNKPTPNIWIFRFTSTVQSPAYPLTISVKFEKTGEVIEKERVVNYAEVTETLTQYGAQTGTLTAIGVTGATVVKGSDGYYHFGSATGPIVVIKLKGPIPTFYPSEDFETLDKDGSNWYTFLASSDDTHDYFIDYARFLRGYTAYTDKPTIEVEEYYLKYVNADGVYPLTDELKGFLEYVAKYNKDWFMGLGGNYAQEDSLWLFSAFYYKEAATTSSLSDVDLAAWKKED